MLFYSLYPCQKIDEKVRKCVGHDSTDHYQFHFRGKSLYIEYMWDWILWLGGLKYCHNYLWRFTVAQLEQSNLTYKDLIIIPEFLSQWIGERASPSKLCSGLLYLSLISGLWSSWRVSWPENYYSTIICWKSFAC